MVVMLMLLGTVLTKLVWVQTVSAAGYAAAGEDQRSKTIDLPAQRGAITDRNGVQLAFSIEGRRLAVRPAKFVDDLQRQQVADLIMAGLAGSPAATGVTRPDLLAKMVSKKSYVYVADHLLPTQYDAILKAVRAPLLDPRLRLSDPKQKDEALNAVSGERQDIREYPSAGVADAVVGKTGWTGDGLSGIETRYNATLAGVAGSRDVDVDSHGRPIPGTIRDETPAADGTSVQLTLDSGVQYTGQQMLARCVDAMGAKGGNMLAIGVGTGKVVAMTSYIPGKRPGEVSNMTVNSPVEPGSVNKVATFAAALDRGLITPTTVSTVDGRIAMGGVTVGDAWSHGPVDMTATGILAKSSNVGTLMLAQRVGEKGVYDQLRKFGIGTKTGIQLNGESAGLLPKWNAAPAKSQWTASTFANIPIGQGVAMTMVQLASMYQAIANNGVRMPPTLIESTTAGGVVSPAPTVAGTAVMTAKSAKTLQSMLTSTMQDGDMAHRGTAPAAAIPGYQVAGKTGTAQQVDPNTKRYSDSLYTTTFAGFLPADNPKYVVVISLDRPSGDREGGTSAAPLFHDFGAYLMDAMNVPPSSSAAPVRELYVNLDG
jgi:cell division protein FtsI (penicillin-binding protein 3)